jgi:hypothetical protein
MAIVFADKVKVRSYSTGTAEFTLETTVPGFQSFAAIGAGNECYYGIEDAAGNWEVGIGTYDTDSTQELLFRDTVISSSNSNNLVNFPRGGKSVFVTIPSSVAANIIASTTFAFKDIAVSGQTTVSADSTTDTLTLVAGDSVAITTDAPNDTITIAADLSAVGQDILPAVDSDGTTGYDLGSPTAKWRELYVANGSIYIGDVKLSNVAGKLVVVKVINPGEENEAEDPDDSDASSEIGGGVDGLTGNTNFNPTVEGNTRYELDINGDIKLRIYETGNEPNDLGPGISLGRENGGNVGSGVVAIGNSDTGYDSKRGGVYIGYQAGWNDAEDPQGEFAIAIGARAARNFAQDNSITLNATGENLDPTADGLYIKPIREVVENTAKALYYNTTTGEVSYADPTSGSGGGVDSNIWIQTFETATPATDVPQVATSVEYDADGNIIALFSHINPVDNNTYYSVGKYTTTGTRIWTTRFDDDFYTDGWGLAVDNDGGFVYIAGSTGADGGQTNSTLTKISGVTGLVEWSKKYDFGYNSSSSVVDVNAEGDPVMVGYADNGDDRYVTTTKIDQTDGSIIWSRALDGQGDEQAYGMAVGPSNEVVAVGYMSQLGDSSDTEDHIVVVKYNSLGVIQWQRAILFDEGYDSTGADADIDSEGNIYVCGQYETDIGGPTNQLMSIIKFDSMGVKQWSRRIVGNCGAFTSSIVVGADDHLYLSATTFAGTEFSVTDVHLVLAKYEFDGTVAWQRLLDYTVGYSFGAFFFGSDIGGSNLAVKQDYVAVGLGFGSEGLFEGPGSINAAIAQIPASGNVFTVGNWDFKAASFSGTVNSTASDIVVDDADKTDYDNISGIDTATVTLEEDSSNFLVGTLFTAPSGDNSLVNGAYSVTLENNGAVTLPAGGTITEGVVTSNPTIQLTPASPDVASQKLVIKGGGTFNYTDNGININYNNNTAIVGDTLTFYVYSDTYANQTLYWWISPEGAGIGDSESGTVTLSGSSGDFSILVDSDDYEFTVRVSPEANNYDPANLGVETGLINPDAPTFDGEHHLHLTTGNLAETSIFLGTDDHNVRTTVNGGIEITTPNTSNNVWQFGTDGSLTVPGDIRSEGNINIEVNLADSTLSDSTLRRWQFGEDGDLILPAGGDIKDSSGNSVLGGGTGEGFTVLADGTLQANVEGNVTVATVDLTTGLPGYLTITPRSPDRNILDTHYGFDSTGMWFAGDNEETFDNSPAYPIHTTGSFPADVKTVVEFEIDYVDGAEDWGICVYPADGVPHWSWEPHPSRIAAMIDIGDGSIQIQGFTDSTFSSLNNPDPGTYTARFTYDPIAELSTFEIEGADGVVFSRCQQPGRLARDQDYRIGFDADWDNAGVGEKSYFTGLTITSGNTTDAKSTELTVTGEIKLPSSVKGFVNIAGPWENNDNNIQFQSVVTHNGHAYILGLAEWAESNRIRIDKYSLNSGELVWTRVLGAGRNAQFTISWTGGAYTLDNISSSGTGYQVGQLVYIAGDQINGGQQPDNRVTITVTGVDTAGAIQTATIAGTAPSGTDSQSGLTEYNGDARGEPNTIKYDTVTDTLVLLTSHYTAIGDANDSNWDRALLTRINPVSGDVVSTVTLSDEGDIRPYDVAVHPTTGATAVVGEKYNEYRAFGTLTMAAKGDGYFDILKSELDEEHYPGSNIPGEYFNDFWISGTGVPNREFIDQVNYYENVSSTTRQGSGTVTVNVATDGTGPYTYGAVTVTAGGSNYRVGHQILYQGGVQIPGGSSPFNDLILTVTGVDGSGVITSATASGTADSDGLILNLSNGTNYNVGSGFTLDIEVDTVTGSRIANVSLGGSNYVANDVAVIPGTVFAGGATPANDVTVTIVEIGEAGGNVTSAVTAGTTPTNILRIFVDGVDFTAGGEVTATADISSPSGGYNAGSYTDLTTTGGSGTGLTVNATSTGGYIDSITIVSAGKGYTTGNTITLVGGDGNGCTFTITANALGAWTMTQDLSGEAFVWTPTWNKAIGGPSNDQFQSVVYSKDGASIYAVGSGSYEVTHRQSLVVKYATSDGTIGFSKYLNSSTNDSYATGVATIGTSDIVVAGYEYNTFDGINLDQQFVARLTSSGTVVWKKFYGDGNWGNSLDNNCDIQVDSDNNIYVTIDEGPDSPSFSNRGFTVTKLDQDGNLVWTRCVNGQASSNLSQWNGNRFSSLANDQLVVAGTTYVTSDEYSNGLWVSFPTDGFTYFGGEDQFVQQGAFRVNPGRITNGVITPDTGGSFTPSVQAPTITASNNLKKYETREPIDFFEQHLHKITDPKHGGLVFGDGSRQTFATDKIPQIKANFDHTITAQDSGKHIYYKNHSGTVFIPAWDPQWQNGVALPVGFTFTIVNRSGGDCYVELSNWMGPRGTIHGSGRNSSLYVWGIPDSGSGSMVTLLLLEAGKYLGDGNYIEPVWMISGPDDIYPAD